MASPPQLGGRLKHQAHQRVPRYRAWRPLPLPAKQQQVSIEDTPPKVSADASLSAYFKCLTQLSMHPVILESQVTC